MLSFWLNFMITEISIKYVLQFASKGYLSELAVGSLKALQNGIFLQYAKPLLIAEVRRIFPSAAGVPLELGLYTAAVVAANLKGKPVLVAHNLIYCTNRKHKLASMSSQGYHYTTCN